MVNPITDSAQEIETGEVETVETDEEVADEVEVKEEIDWKAKAEDLDRKYKASSKEAQDLKWETKVYADNTQFIKLYNADKTRAERLAVKRGYKDAKAALADVKSKQSSEKPEAEVEDIDAKLDTREAKTTLNSYIKEKGIHKDDGFKEDFMEIYEDLTDGKKMDAEKAERYAKIAYQEAKKTSKFAEEYKKVQEDMKGAGAASMQANRQSATSNQKAKSFFDSLKPQTPKDWYK